MKGTERSVIFIKFTSSSVQAVPFKELAGGHPSLLAVSGNQPLGAHRNTGWDPGAEAVIATLASISGIGSDLLGNKGKVGHIIGGDDSHIVVSLANSDEPDQPHKSHASR